MKKLIRTLFTARVKDAAGSYIRSLQDVETLIAKDLLYVDIQKPYVALSARLHIAYMDDEAKIAERKRRVSQKERDKSYKTLMRHILAYINYRRGMCGLPFQDPDAGLDFLVMNIENTRPTLLGIFQGAKLDYQLFQES